MNLILDPARVLVCGWRHWAWPETVHTICDRLLARYGDQLVLIEGRATGADTAVHDWCLLQKFDERRHRCHPIDWAAERRARPTGWRSAGPDRNSRMLLQENPQLIIACHPALDPERGGTSDMCVRGLIAGVPTWLVPSPEAALGRWLCLKDFPERRVERIRADLDQRRAATP